MRDRAASRPAPLDAQGFVGHGNASVLNGGWASWLQVGGIAETDDRKHDDETFQVELSPRRHASAANVLNQRGKPNAVLIDVRPAKMNGEGHIPWAVNIPWAKNLTDNGCFRSARDL